MGRRVQVTTPLQLVAAIYFSCYLPIEIQQPVPFGARSTLYSVDCHDYNYHNYYNYYNAPYQLHSAFLWDMITFSANGRLIQTDVTLPIK